MNNVNSFNMIIQIFQSLGSKGTPLTNKVSAVHIFRIQTMNEMKEGRFN